MAAMLEVDVQCRLGALNLEAQFSAGAGITALFGRSGAGKTSIVNAVSGLLPSCTGRVAVDGRVLLDTAAGIRVPAHRRRIGYVFQDGRLFPHLSVRSNLLFGRRFAPRGERWGTLDHVVDLLDLPALMTRRPAHLSGGEQQRVAIGRALLAGPRALIMDEPLASLDTARKEEVLPYLVRVCDELKIPALYVSHAMAEVTRIAETLVLVSDGRVVAAGPVDEVIATPDLFPLTGRHEAGVVLNTTVEEHDERYGLTVLRCAAGQIRVPRVQLALGQTLRVRIRARDVVVAIANDDDATANLPPQGLSTQTALKGRVVSANEREGPIVDLMLDCAGSPLAARVTRRSADQLDLKPGRSVWALVKSVSFDRRTLGITPAAHEGRSD